MPQRLLILKLSSLGDIVHALPVAASLRAARPQDRIAWAVGERWLPLVERHPALDQVIPLTGANWRAVRAFRPDIALDLQGNFKSSLLARLSGAHQRLGLDRPWLREPAAGWFYTRRVRPSAQHITGQLLDLAAALGAAPRRLEFSLPVPDEISREIDDWLDRHAARPFVFLLPGGGWESKLWPAQRFCELAQNLRRELGLVPVVNHSPRDPVFTAMDAVIFNGGLLHLAALLQRASLVVGGDTGPLHLAAALGSPVVGLFGPTDPVRNGPCGPHTRVLYKGPHLASLNGRYARGRATSPELLAIEVGEVSAACAALLASPAS